MDNPLRRSLKNRTSGGIDINQIQFDLRKSGNFNKIGGEEGEENQMNYSYSGKGQNKLLSMIKGYAGNLLTKSTDFSSSTRNTAGFRQGSGNKN